MSLEKIMRYVEEIKVLEKELEQDKQIESTELNNQSDSYKAETHKITDSISKLSSQIKMVEDEIACNIQDAYIDKAYAELASEMKFWGVNKPARKSTNSLQTLEERLKKLLIEKKHLEGDGRNKINESDSKIVSSIQKQHNNNRTAIQEKLQKIKENILEVYNEMVKHSVRDYSSDAEPCQVTDVPCTIDIGNVQTETPQVLKKYGIVNSDYLKLPFCIDLTSPEQCYGNLYLDMVGVDDSIVEHTLVGLMMKYLESFPKKRLKFGVYSAVGESMDSLADFFAGITQKEELSPDTEEIEGIYVSHLPKIAATISEFEDLLSAIEDQEAAIASQIRISGCDNLFDLYSNGADFEPFQLIVLHNVFQLGRLDSLQRLFNCLKSGERLGVRFVIINTSSETEANYIHGLEDIISKIKKHCFNLTYFNKAFASETISNIQLIQLKKGASPFLFVQHMGKYKEKSVEIKYEKIGFENTPEAEKAFDLISIPVGVSGIKTWNMRFACEADAPIANVLLGLPKSGKSTLIDSLILNGAMKYSPKDINFQIIDFKEGISASAYTSSCKIPHITVVSQNNSSSEADIILNNLEAMNRERVETFKRLANYTGRTIPNIVEYNKWIVNHPNETEWKKMPRVFVIVDECQHLFEVQALSDKCINIIRMGRSQGIHMILSSQQSSGSMNTALKFVEGRYCFRLPEELASPWLGGKGRIVQNDLPVYAALASNNMGNDCSKVRIAFHGKNMEYYAAQIRKRWKDDPINPLIIGDKSPLSIGKYDLGSLFANGNVTIPLGEDYETHNFVGVGFDGKKQSSMLLVGRNQRNIDNVLISTTLCSQINGFDTYIVDASEEKVLTKTHQNKGGAVSRNIHLFAGSQYTEALLTVYEIYKNRNPETKNEPLFFVVNAAQNIDPISDNLKITAEKHTKSSGMPQRSDYDSDRAYKNACIDYQMNFAGQNISSSNTNISAQSTLLELVKRGYARGIFVCVSMDGFTQFDRSGVETLVASNIIFVTNGAQLKERDWIVNDKVGLSKYASVNENMMLLKYMQGDYCRFRVINYQ